MLTAISEVSFSTSFLKFPSSIETVDYLLHPEALPESPVFLTPWHCPSVVITQCSSSIYHFLKTRHHSLCILLFHKTLKTVICPDHDLGKSFLTSSPNSLFPQPESAHVSTSFAHISFLKRKPAYLISGYLPVLLTLSFLPLQSPQSLVSSLHSDSQGNIMPVLQIFPKYSVSTHVDDGASQAPRMKPNVQRHRCGRKDSHALQQNKLRV